MLEQVIEILSAETGVLRCRHGDRLVALYARGWQASRSHRVERSSRFRPAIARCHG